MLLGVSQFSETNRIPFFHHEKWLGKVLQFIFAFQFRLTDKVKEQLDINHSLDANRPSELQRSALSFRFPQKNVLSLPTDYAYLVSINSGSCDMTFTKGICADKTASVTRFFFFFLFVFS